VWLGRGTVDRARTQPPVHQDVDVAGEGDGLGAAAKRRRCVARRGSEQRYRITSARLSVLTNTRALRGEPERNSRPPEATRASLRSPAGSTSWGDSEGLHLHYRRPWHFADAADVVRAGVTRSPVDAAQSPHGIVILESRGVLLWIALARTLRPVGAPSAWRAGRGRGCRRR
jgi:hypothetical protein